MKSNPSHAHVYLTTEERMTPTVAHLCLARSSAAEPCEVVRDDVDTITLRFLPRHPTCRFRAFATLEDAAAAHVVLLVGHYPAAIDAAEDGDPAGFVHGLKSGGYFPPAGSGRLPRERRPALRRIPLAHACYAGANSPAAIQALGAVSIVAFQEARGLVPDGVVGPKTRAALREALASAGLPS